MRPPPAHLEARILEAIQAEKPEWSVAPRAASSSRMNWLPWALAACLALGCVMLAADRAKIRKEMAHLEKRDVFAQMKIATLASQLESAPRANAVVLWDAEKQEGVLKLADVPPNDTDRDYQLWIVDPDYKQPVDAGVFHLSDDGATRISFRPKLHVTTANAFAVSLERKGGVPKAEGPMILLGK
ncbi:MAG: anti-sigma factor [Burkholderiaceae bacterium]|nr:anti-sigma factor [Burkholderiaceae bacterium]